jgi:hypothetical protein
MATKTEDKAQEIRKAIDDIRAFYKTGKNSLKTKSGRAHSDAGELGEEIQSTHGKPHYLTRARQFADPALGYTQEDLNRLFGEFKKYQFALRPSTVFHLLSVRPKTVRNRLQREAIRQGWSAARLHLEIIRRFGPRTVGGRRRRVASDTAELLAQLESECEKWRRWHAALNHAGLDGKVPLQSLPRNVLDRMAAASKCIVALQDAVENELAKVNAARRTRSDVSGAGSARL